MVLQLPFINSLSFPNSLYIWGFRAAISIKVQQFLWLQSTVILGEASHMSGRKIWIFFEAPQQYIHHINPWKKCSNLMQFLKYLAEPFSRSLRSLRSNDLKTKNDENSKWKLVKTRWNPKFGLSDLENDLLTSTTLEEAQWFFFSKITFLKSVYQVEKNEL